MLELIKILLTRRIIADSVPGPKITEKVSDMISYTQMWVKEGQYCVIEFFGFDLTSSGDEIFIIIRVSDHPQFKVLQDINFSPKNNPKLTIDILGQ